MKPEEEIRSNPEAMAMIKKARAGKLKFYPLSVLDERNKKSRQAKSIARIRSERRTKKLCLECDSPAAVKTIASTGQKKILTRCQHHLDLLAERRK